VIWFCLLSLFNKNKGNFYLRSLFDVRPIILITHYCYFDTLINLKRQERRYMNRVKLIQEIESFTKIKKRAKRQELMLEWVCYSSIAWVAYQIITKIL
jgi:hypothetical protein